MTDGTRTRLLRGEWEWAARVGRNQVAVQQVSVGVEKDIRRESIPRGLMARVLGLAPSAKVFIDSYCPLQARVH